MDPISLIVASMQNDMQRMNSVANNAANAMTPGFKREIASVMSMQSITAEITDGKKTAVEVPVVTTRADPAQGVLRQTGRMLDVALSGEGYFEVLTPQEKEPSASMRMAILSPMVVTVFLGNPAIFASGARHHRLPEREPSQSMELSLGSFESSNLQVVPTCSALARGSTC